MSFDGNGSTMSVEIQHEGGTTVVVLRGEFDLANVERLRDAFESAGEPSSAMIDMREVEFIDSTAIGAVVAFGKRIAERGGEMQFMITRPAIKRVFVLLGLDKHFPIIEHPGHIA